jgi:hypothetical protein
MKERNNFDNSFMHDKINDYEEICDEDEENN